MLSGIYDALWDPTENNSTFFQCPEASTSEPRLGQYLFLHLKLQGFWVTTKEYCSIWELTRGPSDSEGRWGRVGTACGPHVKSSLPQPLWGCHSRINKWRSKAMRNGEVKPVQAWVYPRGISVMEWPRDPGKVTGRSLGLGFILSKWIVWSADLGQVPVLECVGTPALWIGVCRALRRRVVRVMKKELFLRERPQSAPQVGEAANRSHTKPVFTIPTVWGKDGPQIWGWN